jgi:hypothetical protein
METDSKSNLKGFGEMEIHELCAELPEIEGEPFEQLKNDIEKKGLLHPILVYEGKIIDGKNRLRALQALNIEPTVENGMLKIWEGNGSLKGFIASLNLLRRHLTSSQRAVYAVDYLEDYQIAAKERQGKRTDLTSDKNLPEVDRAKDKAAKDFSTNRQYLNDAEKIKKVAPEKLESIKSGEKTISQVKKELNATKKLKTKNSKPKKLKIQYQYEIRGFKRYGSRETTLGKSNPSDKYETLKETIEAGMKKLKEYAAAKKKYDGHIWLNIDTSLWPFIKTKLKPPKSFGYFSLNNRNDQDIFSRKYECKNQEIAILDEKTLQHCIPEIDYKIARNKLEIQFYENLKQNLLNENNLPEATEPRKDDYDISRIPRPKNGIIIYNYPDGTKTEIKATVSNRKELEKIIEENMPKDFDIINGEICTSGGL